MRRLVFTFIFATVAVTSVAAQQLPATVPPTSRPSPSTPIQSVVPMGPGQTPPPTTQTPPPAVPPTTPTPGQQRPPTQVPPSRPPDSTPPVIPVMPQGNVNRYSPDSRNSGRTWQNVAVEITITDSASNTKTANMLVLDGESGQVRSAGAGTINVDVLPSIRPDGRIFLRMTLEYLPDLSGQQAQAQNVSKTSFNQSLSLILVPSKQVLVSQTSDPKSDREVKVHITATVEK